MLRYLAGLGTGAAATTAGLWLLAAPFALGHAHPRIGRPAAIDLMAGAVITVLGLITVATWATGWRDRLRADGVLTRKRPARPSRPARRRPAPSPAPAPAAGPTTDELRDLLTPLVAALTAQQPRQPGGPGAPPPQDFRYEPPEARHREPRQGSGQEPSARPCPPAPRGAARADDTEEAW